MKCPCGSEKEFTACCDTFITGGQFPATPEQLMRSRYTAYTLSNLDYIISTMTSPALDEFDVDATRNWLKKITWIKLEVSETSVKNDIGYVEFHAHFTENKKKHTLHELSEFHLVDGRWFYVDGNDPCDHHHHEPVKVTRIGRNDPCLCGSGKKHKKCCGMNA